MGTNPSQDTVTHHSSKISYNTLRVSMDEGLFSQTRFIDFSGDYLGFPHLSVSIVWVLCNHSVQFTDGGILKYGESCLCSNLHGDQTARWSVNPGGDI